LLLLLQKLPQSQLFEGLFFFLSSFLLFFFVKAEFVRVFSARRVLYLESSVNRGKKIQEDPFTSLCVCALERLISIFCLTNLFKLKENLKNETKSRKLMQKSILKKR